MPGGKAQRYLVIGGGLVGSAAALRLQAAGFAVTLLDPGDMRRAASYGNAGLLSPEQVAPLSSWGTLLGAPGKLFGVGGPLDFRARDIGLWLPFGLRFMAAAAPATFRRGADALTTLLSPSVEAWARLLEIAQRPELMHKGGHWSVWMDADAGRKSIAQWHRTPIGSAQFRELTRAELDHLGSCMSRMPAAGIFWETSAQMRDPQSVRDALLAEFVGRGGKREMGEAQTLQPHEGGVRALCQGKTLEADSAVVACGAWSNRLMAGLGHSVPLVGERGYHLQSTNYTWPEDLPTVVFEEPFVVLTRFSSGLRATSFTEVGDPSAPADARKWDRLEAHLKRFGIKFGEAPDRWMGPRPTLPDFLPAIGRLKACNRVLYAFGHQHLGLTMSAITAEQIEALAQDRSPTVDLRPFRVERFSGG